MKRKMDTEDYNPKTTAFAIVPAIICPFAFLFQFGFNIGTINASGDILQRFYNRSFQERFNETIPHSQLELLWPLTTASFSLGGTIGTFLVKPMLSRFGELRSMFFVQPFCLVGSFLLFVSHRIHSHEAIIIGEILNGLYCSIGTSAAPIYVRGVTIPRLRGTMGGFFGAFLVTGIIAGNTFGLKQLLGTDSGWPYLLAITAVPSLIFISYYRWMPENPRTVYVKTRNENSVLDLLTRLYGTVNVGKYLDEYKTDVRRQIKNLSLWQILKTHYTRWQLLSAVVVLSSVQISGINGITYNFNNVLVAAGVEVEITPYLAISSAAIQIVTAVIVSTFVFPKWGRKKIFLFGNSMQATSCFVYTLTVAFQNSASWVPYLSIVATFTFGIGLNSGSGVVSFALAPETLTQSARAVGMSAAVFFMWISFVLVSFSVPFLFKFLKFGALLPFLAIILLLMLYVYLVIPETKNMNDSEIDEFFQRRSRGCCKKSKPDREASADGNTEIILKRILTE